MRKLQIAALTLFLIAIIAYIQNRHRLPAPTGYGNTIIRIVNPEPIRQWRTEVSTKADWSRITIRRAE